MSQPAAAAKTGWPFLLRRLHGLSGVVPLGAFLIMHLWTNGKALSGRTCFQHAVEDIQNLPFLVPIEVIFIILPLTFHALYGIRLALLSRSNLGRYGYSRNWLFFLQRATGLLALGFLIVHLWDFRVAKALGQLGPSGFFDGMFFKLGVKWRALLYLFGTTAVVFHFFNGVRTWAYSWGLFQTKSAERRLSLSLLVGGSLLWLYAANTVVFFASGAGFLPTRAFRSTGAEDVCAEPVNPIPGPNGS